MTTKGYNTDMPLIEGRGHDFILELLSVVFLVTFYGDKTTVFTGPTF